MKAPRNARTAREIAEAHASFLPSLRDHWRRQRIGGRESGEQDGIADQWKRQCVHLADNGAADEPQCTARSDIIEVGVAHAIDRRRIDDAVGCAHRRARVDAQCTDDGALDGERQIGDLDPHARLRGLLRRRILFEREARDQRAVTQAQSREFVASGGGHPHRRTGHEQPVQHDFCGLPAREGQLGGQHDARTAMIVGAQFHALVRGHLDRQRFLVAATVGDHDHAPSAPSASSASWIRAKSSGTRTSVPSIAASDAERSYSPPPSSPLKP